MKRFILMLLALTMAVTVAACREDDTTPPVIEGVEDVTIYLDEEFDPMEGVTAHDDVDGDLTDEITVSGSVDTSKTGQYYLIYRVEDSSGNKAEESRYVTVEVDPDMVGDEMVPNGDFSLGMSFWTVTQGLEGGTGNFDVVDGELRAEITGVGGGLWEPRLENIGITFEEGQAYEITFDARAEEPRSIHIQVGELLDDAPWFLNFKPAQTDIVDITTDMETYTVQFIMAEETNENGALLFEFGTVEGGVGTDNLLTTVYLDNVAIEEIDDIDPVPPVIEGADDVTIEIGTEFDPLEGITASDALDGDLTDQIEVTGEVDVDEEGVYELTYKVTNEAGLETVVVREVTVAEIDMAPYPADHGWRIFYNDWEGTEARAEVVGGEYVFTITQFAAMDQNWKLQVIQDAYALSTGEDNEGSIEFAEGETYRVTFDARASVAGDIMLAIGHAGDGWTPYFEEEISITTDMDTYTVEFTLDDDDVDYSVPAQFKLEMGLLFADKNTPQEFVLDNVMIEIDVDGEFVDADLIVNGDFKAEVEYPDYGWRAFYNDWEGTAAYAEVVDGEYVLNLENIAAMDENWKIQVIQDAYALSTGEDNEGSMEFAEGETYRVTFDARASVAGDITLAIGHAGDGWTPYYMEDISITTDMDTYTVEFTLDDDDVDYSVPAQFKFEMGLLFAGEEAPQYFALDNVMIEIEVDGEFVDAGLVVNGTFEGDKPGLDYGWRAFFNDWEGTTADTEVVDGELFFNITNIAAMDANWKLQVIQDAYALSTGEDNEGSILFREGETYRVTFDARASVAGDITLAIGHSEDGWTPYFMEDVSITTDMDTYTVEFTLDDDDVDYSVPAQFKFEMGMLFAGEEAPQYFVLDNVMIEIEVDGEFHNARLLVNSDFSIEE